jgi:hypothetical protein
MKIGPTYFLVVAPWILFTGYAMAHFSPWWGFLLIVPASISLSSKDT